MARIVGRAGGSLDADSSWAENEHVAALGSAGEKLTASILKSLPDGVVVLHDLDVRIPGFPVNVDHVVIAGRHVWLIDSKNWKPGTYLTFFGRTFRGLRRFKYADKQTLPMALNRYRAAVPNAKWVKPAVVIHSSNRSRPINLTFYRPRGAKAFTAKQFADEVKRFARNKKSADPGVVNAMMQFVR